MQTYINVIIPLFILYFSGIIDWFQLKIKKGVFYSNNWARSLLTIVGFAIILYMDRMFLKYILSSNWVYLLVLVPVMMFIGKSREHIIIYNRSRSDVEKILEDNLRYYDIPFVKEEDDSDVYNYLFLDTNENIKLKVGLSFFINEEGIDDTIHLHIKKKGEASFLNEALAASKEQIRQSKVGGGFSTRIRFQGWILVFSTLLLFTFLFVSLLA